VGFPTKKRKWYLFDPKSKEPFTLSRSKIELFTQCKRCFYLDTRHGLGRPKGPPFALNSAVDTLLKKEFDIHRERQSTHPLMKVYGIDAVPFSHEKIEEWRDALKRGVGTLHKKTNLYLRGGIDDVWVNPAGELIVVDYKATSKEGPITLDDEWKIQYKRQMEIYQWLFRQNSFAVSDTGYFVYVNGKTDRKSFDGKLEFDVAVIPYTGSDSWIEGTLEEIKECLMSDTIPTGSFDCEVCSYVELLHEELGMANVGKAEIKSPASKAKKIVKKTTDKVSTKPKGLENTLNLF
jgi:hypothetical protein